MTHQPGRVCFSGDIIIMYNSLVGLIDSLGNVRIPAEYEVYPLNNNLLFRKTGKWRIIDKQVRNIILFLVI
jgi:hypothetical protein